jgi:glucoside 3-dehydrogenase (cytochrome c) hitch-hiker subunit
VRVKEGKVNRRALLLGAVVLLGGAGALSRFSRKTAGASPATGPSMSAEQFALLEQITEVMIPTTDTPGAIEAGVPAFIREMLEEWASPASRADIAGVLEGVEKHAWAKFGASFVELPPERRHEVVRGFDEDRAGRQDPAYGKFKYLVLAGYYLSEVGATQELRYELIPGAWRACVPFSEIGRATAVG